jgi:hypothetical protein
MTRNLKALGLALVAVFAMSAVLAAGAQASGTLTVDVDGGENADLTGEQVAHNGVPHHSWIMFFAALTCTNVSFNGTTSDDDTELTITPNYGGCTLNTRSVTTTMNGCDYEFKGGNVTAEGGKQDHFVEGTVRLNCPGSVTGAEIHVYNDIGHIDTICTYTMLEYDFKGENTYVNDTDATPHDVQVTTSVKVTIQRTSGSFVTCGPPDQTWIYTGSTRFRAYKHGLVHNAENQLSLTLTDPTP